MNRTQTRPIFVKGLQIGGQNKVIIQSMTNTKTKDVQATLQQIRALESFGCQMVRLAILDEEDAMAIKEIVKETKIPLVADIHFNYKLA
jgi:(E)-4-hydroxy-3-methylbut-2-enyl-diphosphate synthase